MTEHEATAAVEAIARQLRDREPGTDNEVFAREIIVMLQGRGWRPTEARRPPHWKEPRPGPAEDTYSRGLAAARESLGGAA